MQVNAATPLFQTVVIDTGCGGETCKRCARETRVRNFWAPGKQQAPPGCGLTAPRTGGPKVSM
eukprot:10067090-Lingulodinium_polyedra.AAC.1